MKNYTCDLEVTFPNGFKNFLTGQKFTVNDASELEKVANEYYRQAAGAESVRISFYILMAN